ncbi:hypothetical protein [Nocardia paucivorans]|uniref:hypothetical protein n=1 Tax=Nocardia paucivorans TaxID=114259 RepID=UPI0005948C45|nr:hypothetical protein [Nocardia paucivorans]
MIFSVDRAAGGIELDHTVVADAGGEGKDESVSYSSGEVESGAVFVDNRQVEFPDSAVIGIVDG